MIYDVRDVAISGVFAFNELELSSSFVRRVLCEFAIGPNCVSNCSYDVRFVVSRYILRWENVFWYDVGSLSFFLFVVLQSLLFRLCDGGRLEGVVSSVLGMFVRKSVTGFFPRSTPMTGHLPPFDFCSRWWTSRKVLLCLLVLSLTVWLQPPRRCVLFRGAWHFEQVGVGPVLRLHLCTCTPHATSRASRRAR